MSHWPSRLGSDQILHLVMKKDAAFPVHSYRFTADLLWRPKLRPKPITCLKTAKDTTRRHTTGRVLLITWSVDAACRLAASPLKQTMALGGVSVNDRLRKLEGVLMLPRSQWYTHVGFTMNTEGAAATFAQAHLCKKSLLFEALLWSSVKIN